MDNNKYCVLWNNYHGSLINTLVALQKDGHLLDVTIVCADGRRISAHQLILAACSAFFKDFIKDNPSRHPIVLLPSDIKFYELQLMIEFMYTGQVSVHHERLQAFIKGARYLQIKGLEDNSDQAEFEITENEREKEVLESNKKRHLNSSKVNKISNRKKIKSSHMHDLADSDDNWELIERKPIILPNPGMRKKRMHSNSQKQPLHVSGDVVCYEQDKITQSKYLSKDEPINKIRRTKTAGVCFESPPDMCTCTSKKTWSVRDTEALLKAWKDTLDKVPPSYFIRSMSLCKQVAKTLQQRKVQKNWRQCQVKMKNLHREVRMFKEGGEKSMSTRKPSEVANACGKFLRDIEDIFNKEESIRRQWTELRNSERHLADTEEATHDIFAQVSVSDLCGEDTDGGGVLETSSKVYSRGGPRDEEDMEDDDEEEEDLDVEERVTRVYTLGEDGSQSFRLPHHRMHTGPDEIVHHIVEDSTMLAKQEPESESDV